MATFDAQNSFYCTLQKHYKCVKHVAVLTTPFAESKQIALLITHLFLKISPFFLYQVRVDNYLNFVVRIRYLSIPIISLSSSTNTRFLVHKVKFNHHSLVKHSSFSSNLYHSHHFKSYTVISIRHKSGKTVDNLQRDISGHIAQGCVLQTFKVLKKVG